MASKQEGTVKQLVERYEHRDGAAAALAREEPGARWFDKVQQVLAAGMMERDPAVFHRLIQAGNTHRRRQYYEAKARMDDIRCAKRDAREARRAEEPLPFEERFLRDNGAVCHVARGFWNYLVRVAAEGGGGGGGSDASESSDAEDGSDDGGGGESVDCEWWKRDAFLQDHARHRERGTKWTAVLEGASREHRAPSFELSVRGSYYECSGSWWKAARHRREWEATADIEWWKDSAFYDEWLSGGREGWPAVDEAAGWGGEAVRHPARAQELRRREAWYEANGPRGVVRTWNNAGSSGGGGASSPVSPGSPASEEKCGRREMARRAAYYAHNEEWWKAHAARLQHLHSPASCDALAHLKGPPPVALWWQAKALRDRYDAEGAGAGPDAPWKFAAENGGGGRLSEADVRGREMWYQSAWWMREKHVEEWRAAGGARATGGGWAARCDPATHQAAAQPLAAEEVRRARGEWYEAVAAFDGGEEDEFEFWKARPFIDAFFIAETLLSDGGDRGGSGGGDFSWQAATAVDASEAEGAAACTVAPAATLERRRAWYLANWWRQDKYVEEFHSLARCGVCWRSEAESPAWRDADFWKGRECREEWRLLDEGEGEAGGREGGSGGFQGVAWTAADALSARRNVEEAAEEQAFACSPAEAALRHRWHTRREEVEEEEEEDEAEGGGEGCGDAREWWHAALFFEDFLFHGRDGRRWTAASQELGCCARGGGAGGGGGGGGGPTISEADAAEREEWYLAHWWRVSTLCAEEYHRCAGGSGADTDAHEGALYQRHAACPVTLFRTGDAWWKQRWVAEDYARHGEAGGRWTAGGPVEAVFRMGAATDAGPGAGVFFPSGTPLSGACPTSEAERAERRRYYEETPAGGRDGEEAGAGPALLGPRLEWYRANLRRTAAPGEVGRRARWYCGQLDARERMRRVEWFARRRRRRRRRLSEFELAGVLQEINEGQPASDGAAAAVLEAIVALRRRGQDGDVERPLCFSLDEFLYAVGRTGFYVPPDLEERTMCAAEALLELEQAELSRVEEEAAYVAADAAEEEEEGEGEDYDDDEATSDDEPFFEGGSCEGGGGEEKEVEEEEGKGWRRPDRHSLWLLQNGGAADMASPAKRVWRSAGQQPPTAAETAMAAAPSVVRSRRTGNLWRTTERAAADAGSSSAAASSTSAAAFHGEMLDEDADFAFSGERLRASDPTFRVYAEDTDAAGFFGEKLRDSFFTEHEVYDERVATFYGEKLREGDFEALVETWSRGSVSASRAGGEDDAAAAGAACRSDASASEADEAQLAEEMEQLRLSSDVDPAEARAARRRHEAAVAAAAAAGPEGGAPYRYRADRAAFFGEKIKEEEFFSSFDEHMADFYGEKLREEAFVALFESDAAAAAAVAASTEEEEEDEETATASELGDNSTVDEGEEEAEVATREETDESSRVSLEDEEASASVGATEGDCAADWSGDEGWSADDSSASDARNPHLEDEEMVAVLEAALEEDCGPEWQFEEEADAEELLLAEGL